MQYWEQVKAWLIETGIWTQLELWGAITPSGFIDRDKVLNPDILNRLDEAWQFPTARELCKKHFTLILKNERSETYG